MFECGILITVCQSFHVELFFGRESMIMRRILSEYFGVHIESCFLTKKKDLNDRGRRKQTLVSGGTGCFSHHPAVSVYRLQDKQCTYNVTQRRARAISVAVEKQ